MGQKRIKSKKDGIMIAKVEAEKAPTRLMNNSILGTKIANKNDINTKNDRNKL